MAALARMFAQDSLREEKHKAGTLARVIS